MRRSNFALRLQPTLMEEAKALAKEEGVALNQLINTAVAEKLATSRTRAFFERYTRDADIPRALEILKKAGRGNPPIKGDELPKSWNDDATAPASKPRRNRSTAKPARRAKPTRSK